MKKHIELVWEDIVQLLEEEFPLPIEISAIYYCKALQENSSSSSTCQTPLQVTKLRTPCSRMWNEETKIRGINHI